MTTWLLYALIGTGTGAVYAAIAMGVIITYRGSGVVNFAQGAMATFPALVFLELREQGDLVLPWVGIPSRINLGDSVATVPAFLLAVGVAALIGLMADLLIFRHLRGSTPLAKVIASVGLSTVLIGLAVLQFGAAPRKGPPILPADTIELFGRSIPQDRFWLAGLVCVAGVRALARLQVHDLRPGHPGRGGQREGRRDARATRPAGSAPSTGSSPRCWPGRPASSSRPCAGSGPSTTAPTSSPRWRPRSRRGSSRSAGP